MAFIVSVKGSSRGLIKSPTVRSSSSALDKSERGIKITRRKESKNCLFTHTCDGFEVRRKEDLICSFKKAPGCGP